MLFHVFGVHFSLIFVDEPADPEDQETIAERVYNNYFTAKDTQLNDELATYADVKDDDTAMAEVLTRSQQMALDKEVRKEWQRQSAAKSEWFTKAAAIKMAMVSGGGGAAAAAAGGAGSAGALTEEQELAAQLKRYEATPGALWKYLKSGKKRIAQSEAVYQSGKEKWEAKIAKKVRQFLGAGE